MIRVLIADDHPIVREGLKRIVAECADVVVVGEVADGGAVAPTARDAQADVVVLDVSMPGPGVNAVLAALAELTPRPRILVLSVHPEKEYAVRLLRAGASGYLSKDRSGDELVGAIRRVHDGGLYVSEAVGEQLAARASGRPPEARHELLSMREHQVLVRLASGQSARTIAVEMGLSPKTVHTYRSRIRAKLELDTDAALIRYAVEHKLVE